MKRYQLIREYPGSPKLGTVLTLDIKEGDYGIDINNLNIFRHRNEMENQPEFWQEIEEVINHPIGTKVLNSNTNTIYTKKLDIGNHLDV